MLSEAPDLVRLLVVEVLRSEGGAAACRHVAGCGVRETLHTLFTQLQDEGRLRRDTWRLPRWCASFCRSTWN